MSSAGIFALKNVKPLRQNPRIGQVTGKIVIAGMPLPNNGFLELPLLPNLLANDIFDVIEVLLRLDATVTTIEHSDAAARSDTLSLAN